MITLPLIHPTIYAHVEAAIAVWFWECDRLSAGLSAIAFVDGVECDLFFGGERRSVLWMGLSDRFLGLSAIAFVDGVECDRFFGGGV